MNEYTMPALPDGQRWMVTREFHFVIVKLQERRRWGWRTIAKAVGDEAGGAQEVAMCVDHILRRDYFARLDAERAAKRRQRVAEIPWGTHPGGDQ